MIVSVGRSAAIVQMARLASAAKLSLSRWHRRFVDATGVLGSCMSRRHHRCDVADVVITTTSSCDIAGCVVVSLPLCSACHDDTVGIVGQSLRLIVVVLLVVSPRSARSSSSLSSSSLSPSQRLRSPPFDRTLPAKALGASSPFSCPH